jgi:sulfatase modifying factor 1
MSVEMIEVKGGKFLMGANEGKCEDYPLHEVEVKDFLIGVYPVTQKQWYDVTKIKPSKIKNQDYPVTNINWYEAIEFCNQLSIFFGFEPYYIIDNTLLDENNSNDVNKDAIKWVVSANINSDGFRLPTEEEWEYAAKDGFHQSDFKFSGSDDYKEVLEDMIGPGQKTYKIGQKNSNKLGIYDMSGNVGEWCYDWFYMYGHKEISGTVRIFRGFSTVSSLDDATVYKRKFTCPAFVSEYIGLRVARNKAKDNVNGK